MVRVGTQIVVRAFDPGPLREVLAQRDLEPVAVEAAAAVVHFVLLENREDRARVEPLAPEPRAEDGRLVAELRLVDRRRIPLDRITSRSRRSPSCLEAGELRRTPVDELSAQLDRHQSGTVSSSEDAASNALVRFDEQHRGWHRAVCAPL